MSAPRQSRERRSSKKSTRSTISPRPISSKTDSLATFEPTLQNIWKQEERDLIIYSIREELIEKVLDQCYKKYLEKQCVKFTVHCAHIALIQIVNLGCFHHDPGKPYYKDHPYWLPDKPPKPSPPDTWVAHKVASKPKPQPKSVDKNDTKGTPSQISLQNLFTGIDKPTEETLSYKCKSEGEEIKVLYDTVNVEDTESVQSKSELLVPYGTTVSVLGEEEEYLHDRKPSETLSCFTKISRMPPDDLPDNTGLSLKSLQINPEDTDVPKLLNTELIPSRCKINLSALPPLRADAVYKERKRSATNEKDKEEEDTKVPSRSKSYM